MIPPKRCDYCNKDLLLGAALYSVEIKVVSGFDGYLPESDEQDDEERQNAMDALAENLNAMSEEELEKDVYQEISLTLCPACRRKFLERLADFTGESPDRRARQTPLLQ